jgi:hypothetical protein
MLSAFEGAGALIGGKANRQNGDAERRPGPS